MSSTENRDPKALARRYRDAAPAEQRRMVHAKVRYESRAEANRGWPQTVGAVVGTVTLMPALTALLKWQWEPQVYAIAAVGLIITLALIMMGLQREQTWRKANPFDPEDPLNAARNRSGAPPPPA